MGCVSTYSLPGSDSILSNIFGSIEEKAETSLFRQFARVNIGFLENVYTYTLVNSCTKLPKEPDPVRLFRHFRLQTGS